MNNDVKKETENLNNSDTNKISRKAYLGFVYPDESSLKKEFEEERKKLFSHFEEHFILPGQDHMLNLKNYLDSLIEKHSKPKEEQGMPKPFYETGTSGSYKDCLRSFIRNTNTDKDLEEAHLRFIKKDQEEIECLKLKNYALASHINNLTHELNASQERISALEKEKAERPNESLNQTVEDIDNRLEEHCFKIFFMNKAFAIIEDELDNLRKQLNEHINSGSQ
jgi:hypothetical protein